MASVEANLITYLKTKTAITSIVGTGTDARIYMDFAKQGAAVPYIVIESFEGISFEHISGISGIGQVRVQIDCYGSTEDQAYTLAEAVRLAPLQMYRGVIGSGFANGVTASDGYRRGVDQPADGGNQYRFWVSRDYFITFTESTSA